MSVSKLKLAANRQNALCSTGPRTPEGKQRSSINAYRHCLTGQVVVLPHEDLEAYKSFCQGFFQDLAPQNAMEEQLVQTLIDTQCGTHVSVAAQSLPFA
ncbi:MAG: hypothetical protein ACR2NN_00500 [Bryobacteraceae bacterium]